MLYLDSSALVKRYILEKGSEELAARFERGDRLFTSMLSFAEVHRVLASKFRERRIKDTHLKQLKENFTYDWMILFTITELDTNTMTAVPYLVLEHGLKSADAVHLSAAIWLRDLIRLKPPATDGDAHLEFASSDKELMQAARKEGFDIFDTEA